MNRSHSKTTPTRKSKGQSKIHFKEGARGSSNQIEVSLRDIHQFFNSMDPSPFHERDLDHDAEEFIVSWAQEFPVSEPVSLVIHLKRSPDVRDANDWIEQAVHHYFEYKAKLSWFELKRLLKQGRASLAIGLIFLTVCHLASELLKSYGGGPFHLLTRESLTIAGWVAMWKPMEIYLYDWWPVRRMGRIYEKLSRIPVTVVVGSRTP